MSTAGHTPTPWKVDHDPMSPGHVMTLIVRGSETSLDGDWIAMCFRKEAKDDDSCSITRAQAEANTALIVQAANHYAKLLKALKNLIADIDDFEEIPQQISASTICIARQAVAQAEASAS